MYGTGSPVVASFTRAIASLRQGDLTSKSESLRNALRLNPQLSMNYPFIHKSSYTPSQFTGVPASSGGVVTVPLQGIINADLVALSFNVMLQSDLSTGDYFNWTSSDLPNSLGSSGITNVQVLYNGLVVYNAFGAQYRLINMLSGAIGAPGVNYTLATAATTSLIYPVIIDFSRLRSVTFSNHFANVWRINIPVDTTCSCNSGVLKRRLPSMMGKQFYRLV